MVLQSVSSCIERGTTVRKRGRKRIEAMEDNCLCVDIGVCCNDMLENMSKANAIAKCARRMRGVEAK